MGYSFGWWDYSSDGAEPQMICRQSQERVALLGPLEEPWCGKAISTHTLLPKECWKRFEYRHADFRFPLVVNWRPETGRALLDYNLSAEVWRQETGAETEHPPYGGWARVDEMVSDAFWCWPGLLEGYLPLTKQQAVEKDWFDAIELVGGYFGPSWQRDLVAWESLSCGGGPDDSDCLYIYEYLYADFEAAPVISEIIPFAYKGNTEQLSRLQTAGTEAFVFPRVLRPEVSQEAVAWSKADERNASQIAVSSVGGVLKLGHYDRTASHVSRQSIYDGFHILKSGEQVFARLANTYSSCRHQTLKKRNIAHLYLAYVHPILMAETISGFDPSDWISRNLNPASVVEMNRELLAAARHWSWANDGAVNGNHSPNACATHMNFLGGILAAYRCRLIRFA
ncbi:hypothetical protein [Labrenzia sp. VG12]|uniref:hypothetical protein n=1 Tax=Labrenzia sp. VG12 TaxID=2021862 RepID=UPI000B8C5AF2|nr:hypothetical protein [Labrenzia sp. VG12]ASP32224.1 hypothetical protein CHH27_02365 [Labrenzia sp. VG12]